MIIKAKNLDFPDDQSSPKKSEQIKSFYESSKLLNKEGFQIRENHLRHF